MLPSPAFPGSTAPGRCWRNTKPGRCLILFDDRKHWMLHFSFFYGNSCCLFLYIESMENKAIQIPKPINFYPSTRFSHLQRLSRIFDSVSSSSSSSSSPSSWGCTHSKCCIFFRLDRVVVICRHRPETAIAGVWEVGHCWAKPEGAPSST